MNYIISQPRSGQHLIKRFLEFYSKIRNIHFSYCEYYGHCRTTPCTENRLFQKNHDGNLELNIDSNSKYLVLYRSNFLEHFETVFRFSHPEFFPIENHYIHGSIKLISGLYNISYTEHQEGLLKDYIKQKERDL